MFMPSLGPDALGWRVHRDFAEAVERLGHEFRLLTTPAPGPEGSNGARNREGGGSKSVRNGKPEGRDRARNGEGEGSKSVRSGEPGGRARVRNGGGPAAAGTVTVLAENTGSRRWADLARPLLRTRQLLPAAGALTRYLRDHGDEIDLLHLEVAYPHAAAAMLAVSRSGWRGPYAVTPMGEDVLVVADRSYGMRRYFAPAALVRRTLRRAAGLRCISPMFERYIAELSPDNPRRVIALNISAEAAAAAQASVQENQALRESARARVDDEFGTAGRPLVLSFGRLHPFKGIDLLVDAAASIDDATVLVIGPSLVVRPFGDVASVLKSRAQERGVADKVIVAGAVHPARALEVLAAADVVVVPSPLESLNKVCMEAAAVGTPFVVTQTTGISAWVPEEGVGIVVPPRNTASIAWAIEEIIGGHFAHNVEESMRFARQFSPDRIAASGKIRSITRSPIFTAPSLVTSICRSCRLPSLITRLTMTAARSSVSKRSSGDAMAMAMGENATPTSNVAGLPSPDSCSTWKMNFCPRNSDCWRNAWIVLMRNVEPSGVVCVVGALILSSIETSTGADGRLQL